MRVVTLNLWGMCGDWPRRRAVLTEGLRRLRPDLVAFQEVILAEAYDQAADLLGSDFHLVQQKARNPNGTGIAVASRWPVRGSDELDLHVTPRTAGFECGALVVEVSAPTGPLFFANHFPNWQLSYAYERELQTRMVADHLESIAGDRDVIVAGDLDADPQASSIRFWTGRQSLDGLSVCYRDAWEARHPGEAGITYTPDNPLMSDGDWPFGRIDYVLVRCGLHGGSTLRIDACERIFDQPVDGVWASDHFGVMADLGARTR
ncbi:endonuclease/exonuclease/phosphatase family protein [Fodinicola acaciae]|uniref:endonuclease/exonuclease/phosphatase family protein n=1 Tax=Fodinicola acaciae TaxID=2681555 RepID=UPI0013D3D3C7|nr:endonuclease/exonuclease/phosphatase family protein [Fodinicola acaciae]